MGASYWSGRPKEAQIELFMVYDIWKAKSQPGGGGGGCLLPAKLGGDVWLASYPIYDQNG